MALLWKFFRDLLGELTGVSNFALYDIYVYVDCMYHGQPRMPYVADMTF